MDMLERLDKIYKAIKYEDVAKLNHYLKGSDSDDDDIYYSYSSIASKVMDSNNMEMAKVLYEKGIIRKGMTDHDSMRLFEGAIINNSLEMIDFLLFAHEIDTPPCSKKIEKNRIDPEEFTLRTGPVAMAIARCKNQEIIKRLISVSYISSIHQEPFKTALIHNNKPIIDVLLDRVGVEFIKKQFEGTEPAFWESNSNAGHPYINKESFWTLYFIIN